MKTKQALCKVATLLCALSLPGFSQTPEPTHDGDGGPVLVALITQESYALENRVALHCSGSEECQLCEYTPDTGGTGICHPDNARFYIQGRYFSNSIHYDGIDHFTAVEIRPLIQSNGIQRQLSCSSFTTLSKKPRCRLQSSQEATSSDFCSSFSNCNAFYLMINTLFNDYIDCIDNGLQGDCNTSGFISYYQTPVVIKNDYAYGNFARHKAISCKWASGYSSDTGNRCRMVSEQDCSATQTTRGQCQPQSFIVHMEQPYPKPCAE